MLRRRSGNSLGDVGNMYILSFNKSRGYGYPMFSSNGGESFIELSGLPFIIHKARVAKNGIIACVGEESGRFGMYISRNRGATFDKIDIDLDYDVDRISIAMTEDGDALFILDYNKLYKYSNGDIKQIYVSSKQPSENRLYVSETGSHIYAVFRGYNKKYLIYSTNHGVSFEELRTDYDATMSRDCTLLASRNKRYRIHIRDTSKNLLSDVDAVPFGGIYRSDDAIIGNNKKVYVNEDGNIKWMNFDTRDEGVFWNSGKLLDITATGDIGVVMRDTRLALVHMETGQVIKQFKHFINQHIYKWCAIGK